MRPSWTVEIPIGRFILMNTYETMVILDSALSEDEIKAAKEKITSLITESEGNLIKAEDWGAKKLAYEINKHKKGHYVLLVFSSHASLIKKIEEYFKVYDPVIKYMVIKLGAKEIKALEASMQKAEAQAVSSEAPAAEKEIV
jgi:small subunit ribosomal protein S6